MTVRSTGVGGLFTATRVPDGDDPAWLTTAGTMVDSLFFTAAAVATVRLVGHLDRRRRASRGA
ncbi:hypothetical protein [Kitasatospora sp. MY 5-36]|uniref:hypothetical protein n=1 Tax=Kitasatospora sp. MY 5-36 TaxID=1678027 RepID=UPI000671108D|nr:hypothetical protein [Kitasatospora sp. MY 5-36]